MAIRTKRIYEEPAKADGFRVLVDRLWPRGPTKEKARVDLWLKDVGPSDALRKWFNHEPEKWDEFRRRYAEELKAKDDLLSPIRERAKKGAVTLLFASKEEKLNNATALRELLERHRG